MKQTATEWLIDQMFMQSYFDGSKPLSITNLDHLEYQAKEMEKQQIIDAWNSGDYAYFYSKETGRDFADGSEYYNETYGSHETLKDYHIVDANEMVLIQREDYLLVLSDNPIHLFNHFNVYKMHGLYMDECQHIQGLCNYIPKVDNEYELTDPYFVFINTSKHKGSIKDFGLIMHEMMHMSFKKHSWDINKEEDIITWAEEESFFVYEQIKQRK